MKYIYTICAAAVLLFTACGGAQQPDTASNQTDQTAIEAPEEEPVEELAVGDASRASHIVISKETMTLSLYDVDSLLVCRFPVAVGKNPGNKQREGDMKTPEGRFSISQIQDASSWNHDFGDGNGLIEGCYGNWFMRLNAPPHRGIGIHGTHDPASIGTRATEGCIRLHNENLDSLKLMVRVGMPVEILSGELDRQVDNPRVEEPQPESAPAVVATPVATPVEPSAVATTLTTAADQTTAVAEGEEWYTVEDGDLVGAIAIRFGTTTARIVELNPGLNPDRIGIGDRIRVR